MPSLMELVERVNKGELIDSDQLEVYEESPNSAEKFLAHHAHAMLDLRRAQQHMLQSLEAIDYSDQKVLNQFVSVSGFLGLTDMRAAPVIKFGSCAIARREYALGLEAIQNGVGYDLQHGGAYTSDRENCVFVATQYDRAAQFVSWRPEQQMDWNNKQTKIAYIVSAIADDEPTSRTLLSLARHHDSKRFKLQVYSTEANIRRERQQFAQASYSQPSQRRGKETIDALNRQRITSWTIPADLDILAAARELANQLVRDHIDVAIFDATQADPIAAMVASWEVARARINLCRRTPLYASGIQSVCYTDQARFEADRAFWQRRNIDARFILEGIDADEAMAAAPQRSTYGIPDSAVVLATAGQDLERTISEEFVDTMINVLRAHPQAVYLLIGEGELSWQKRRFESAGVSRRVGYAGRRRDLPGFLRIADLYVAEFPAAGATGVLQAMSMERPVVAIRWGDAIEHAQAADLVGSECTISGRDAGAYIERVSKLIREPQYRAKLGRTMRQRVEQHFAFTQTARQIEQIAEQLIQRSSEASAMGTQAGGGSIAQAA
ncbi:MAG TPA: glycosyltransferase family 4 protein [Tepidisphaeraceae bacterium]|jgi:predicted O-linked N-acetylglucosamine transferase (SPINDLY family)